ncbi:MAG TPA: glycoside hydrolase family 20 zincin-like fold domain-containing protein, partial [Chitinophagaceae bacterium]|nr:glycoside hydrolase family 20 zincin-like fold domain-containing protein [Chitinophagaceae bacterium]
MKTHFLAFLLAINMQAGALYATDTTHTAPAINIIPQPVSVQAHTGTFRLTKNTTIAGSGEGSSDVVALFSGMLKTATGFTPGRAEKNKAAIRFTINTVTDKEIGNEGYRLDIAPSGISLQANRPAGLLYGAQTLLQLLGSTNTIPCAT